MIVRVSAVHWLLLDRNPAGTADDGLVGIQGCFSPLPHPHTARDDDPDPGAIQLLNEYGSQDWELVAVTNQSYRRESNRTALCGYTLASYYLHRPMSGATGISQS